MTEPSTQLEYAPRPPALAGARLRRWGLILVLTVLLIGAVITAPNIVKYVTLLQYQRRCLTYAPPPTQVVLETDPTEAKKLLVDPRYVRDLGSMNAWFVPPQWLAFHTSVGGGFFTSGTAFLHERTTPQGVRCLVAIDVNLIPLPPLLNVKASRAASLEARIIRPGTAFHGPRFGGSVTLGDGVRIRFDSDERLTMFAGQPDPIDPSHFTIHYDLGGLRHTLDGWLVDDETVKIELRE